MAKERKKIILGRSLSLWLNLFYKLLFVTFYMHFQMGKTNV